MNDVRLGDLDEALRMIKDSKSDNPFFNGKTSPVWECAHDCAISCVAACPTIDVVPVVRCKDCKHWKKGQFMGGNSIDDLEYGGSCPLARFARYESDFCSYGERKEADGNG